MAKITEMRASVNLDPLFYPETVAVVGASPDIVRDRAGFFHSLRQCFAGRLYPVNPRHEEMLGLKCYARVSDIPERIDYAIIMLPREKVAGVLKDCVNAGTRFVLVFTSGFSEVGDVARENELMQILAGGQTRMIGPNCIGAHCPERGLAYYPPMMSESPGSVAFFSQSGGHALNFLLRGLSLGIIFNKVISVGNQADLKIVDFIEYFASDDRIKYICGYIEDIKHPERFRRAVEYTVLEKKKPFVLWKGGRSEDGSRATQSHTGAMAVPVKIWDGAMSQMGVINAESQDEMADIIQALGCNFRPRGLRACIAVAGGGSSVELTDILCANGLQVPELSNEVQTMIGEGISQVNTSTKNPIDLGMFGFAPDVLVRSAERAARDPNIDLVAICQYPEIVRFMVKDLWDASVDAMVQGLSRLTKPVVMIMPKVVHNRADVEELRASFIKKLNAAGILSFSDAGRMARTTAKIYGYLRFMARRGIEI